LLESAAGIWYELDSFWIHQRSSGKRERDLPQARLEWGGRIGRWTTASMITTRGWDHDLEDT
jgi:hypothetical protein